MNITETKSGMFKIINSATFKNILFKNVNIENSYSGIGVIAGESQYNTSYFYNVGITGKITGTNNVGSFVGYANGGNIKFEKCYARTEIVTSNKSSSAAGFVGYRHTAIMEADKCYFSGSISENATYRGAIFPTGGTEGRKITDTYYNLDLFTTNTSAIYSGIGIQTDKFNDSNNFENWDFTNDWYMRCKWISRN